MVRYLEYDVFFVLRIEFILAAPNRNRVRILAKSCPDNQSFKSNDPDSSPETTNETQGDQKSMSRRQWMMTCACLSPALITNAYTFVSVQNTAALDKKPGVCHDCQGIGAHTLMSSSLTPLLPSDAADPFVCYVPNAYQQPFYYGYGATGQDWSEFTGCSPNLEGVDMNAVSVQLKSGTKTDLSDSIWVTTIESFVERWPAEVKSPEKEFERGGSFLAGNFSFNRVRVSLEGLNPVRKHPAYKEPLITILRSHPIVQHDNLNNKRRR
ncbi:unnamed protein product [Eruca vesicaria subsp. sativa]|uniref:Uncharacterized protein n=1 Tax=Eruca vesicaria subsp. sativa TaxID=29727 RepID=A0ABC8LJA3_ERUVS|nr:unnamed protein product [Eruca vesicaria subsp. sativa]